jgi:hypothetical protein
MQALQFQQMAVRRKFPGRTGISYFETYQRFVEG